MFFPVSSEVHSSEPSSHSTLLHPQRPPLCSALAQGGVGTPSGLQCWRTRPRHHRHFRWPAPTFIFTSLLFGVLTFRMTKTFFSPSPAECVVMVTADRTTPEEGVIKFRVQSKDRDASQEFSLHRVSFWFCVTSCDSFDAHLLLTFSCPVVL